MEKDRRFVSETDSYVIRIENSTLDGYFVRLSILEKGAGDGLFIELTRDRAIILAGEIVKRINADDDEGRVPQDG